MQALPQSVSHALSDRIFRQDTQLLQLLWLNSDAFPGAKALHGQRNMHKQANKAAVRKADAELLLAVLKGFFDVLDHIRVHAVNELAARGQARLPFSTQHAEQLMFPELFTDDCGNGLPLGRFAAFDEDAQPGPAHQMQLVGFQPIGDLIEIGRQGAFGNTELFGEIVGLNWFACGEQLAAKQLLPLAAVFAGGIGRPLGPEAPAMRCAVRAAHPA